MPQTFVLSEPFVERDKVEVGGYCESSQVGVGPDVRREPAGLRQSVPTNVNPFGLFSVHDMMVGQHLLVELPSLIHRHRVKRIDFAICGEPQKTHLRDAAETTTMSLRSLNPCSGSDMIGVRLKGKRQPDVGVNELHLRRPGFDQSSRWSTARCPVPTNGPMEILRSFDSLQSVSRAWSEPRPSPTPLRAMREDRRARQHRFEFVLKVPCRHYSFRKLNSQGFPDAYDEYEQHSGFMSALEEELKFSFSAKVLGDNVTVVAMEWPEDSEFGLDLVIERNGDKHRIDARSVELLPPLPEGHLTLAAYLQWRRFV